MYFASIAILLLFMCGYSSAQGTGNCNPAPPDTLVSGVGTYPNGVPSVSTNLLAIRSQIGGLHTSAWLVFSATQMQQHGLWCQIGPDHNAGMGSNIGDWYYPTGNGPDGFTLAPTSDPSNNVPYQSLKCTNQIGLVVDGNVTNNQGIVRCTTTIPNLNINTHYWVVYSDAVFSNYTGPRVDSTMTLSILSSRDADPNIAITLSFNVSFGPPSHIECTNEMSQIFSARSHPDITREVIRSRYVNVTEPDMTLVMVRLSSLPKVGGTYTCTVTVESRVTSGTYSKGTGSSTATVTVAATPTALTVNRIALTSTKISWTAPSPAPAGYELFYQTTGAGNSTLSGGNTSNTELTLAGLTLGETYSFFIVAFGAENTPVILPSAHSNTAMITLSIPQLVNTLTLVSDNSTIMVSWTAPQYTPDNYTISYSCQLLCGSLSSSEYNNIPKGGATTYNISSLSPGSNCTVNVTGNFGTNTSNMVISSAITASAASTSVPNGLTNTSVESRSLTVVWGAVPCPDQRGPITGYRLRYSNGTSIVNTTGEKSRQHLLTGLTPFTSYSVQVAAINAGGTGPYSDPALTVETLQDVPGPVSDLSAKSEFTMVQLTISWSPPIEPNGVIIAYEIGSNSSGVFTYSNTTDTQDILRDFTPNTVVVFSVRAYTIIGPGENVTDQSLTTIIPRVAGVNVVSLNSTAVIVSWTPVSFQTVNHYSIHYMATDRTRKCDTGTVNVTDGSFSGVVGGLMTGEQYQFSVSVTVLHGGHLYTGPLSNLTKLIELLPSNQFTIGPDVIAILLLLLISLSGNIIMTVIIVLLVKKMRNKTKSRITNSYDLPMPRCSRTSEIYDIPYAHAPCSPSSTNPRVYHMYSRVALKMTDDGGSCSSTGVFPPTNGTRPVSSEYIEMKGMKATECK